MAELSLNKSVNVPDLEDWIGLVEAASILGVTRQYAYKMAKQGKFESICRVRGTTTLLVSIEEVNNLASARDGENSK